MKRRFSRDEISWFPISSLKEHSEEFDAESCIVTRVFLPSRVPLV